MRMRLPALALALVLTACAGPARTGPATTGPEVDAVRDWFARYNDAVNAGDLDRWITFVADDAVIMPPGDPPLMGLEAIRPAYTAVFNAYQFDFRGRAEEITVDGHLAVVRASIDETLTPKGGGDPVDYRGAWLMVLRKQADGTWKLWRNMWTVFTTPPAEGST
jgi:uncharacterized protein (TIGR02246 family)